MEFIRLSQRLLVIISLVISFLYFVSPVNAEICPYNPNANPCWVIKNPMLTSRRDLGAAVDVSGKVYAVGGYNGNFLNTVEVYDPSTNSWNNKSTIPQGRNAMGFTYFPSNGKFYLAGGYNNGYLSDFYEYDPAADTWTPKSPMNTPRAYFGLVNGSNNKLYAIGGQNNSGNVSTVEEYDPLTNQWILVSSLPTPRTGLGVVSAPNGKIYVIGGHLDFANNYINVSTVEEYDPITNTWSTNKSPMPTPRTTFGISLNANGNIYVVGGNVGNPGVQPDIETDIVEEYNFLTDTWITSSPLPINIDDIGLVLSSNNRLYMIGGRTENNQFVNTTYEGFIPTPPSISLNVPLLKQTDPLWKNQTYDNAQIWSPLSRTIERWGCTLTSAAMVLNFHGINKLPNGTDLSPGTLNTWLKSQIDGYIGTGWVNWLAISRLSKLAKSINNITDFDALEYSRFEGANKDMLKEDIENSIPGILEEPGHFVVGKGYNNDTFEINDPFYDRNTLNDGYSNTFLSLNRLVPSSTDLSYIMIAVNPEVNIVLKDQDGNTVGETFLQQPLIDELNSSNTNLPIRILYVPKPPNGNYQLLISSSNNNQYDLNIFLYDENGEVNTLTQSGFVGPNIPNTFDLSFNRQDSNNSESAKNITFQTLIDDITLGKKIKLINPILAKNLIKLTKSAQRNAQNNRRLTAKLELVALEAIIKPLKSTLIKEPAYSVILVDSKYLRGNL